MVEQRIASGDQEDVRPFGLEAGERGLDQIEPHAPAPDLAAVAHGGENLGRAGHCLGEPVLEGGTVPILGAVVDVDDVEAIEPQALVAVLQGADRAGGGVVEGAAEGQCMREALAHLPRVRCGVEQSADLGGERISVARAAAQRIAEPVFRQSGAVVRRGIVVANADVPGCSQAGDGVLFRHDRAQIAQRCAAGAEGTRRTVVGHACSSGATTPLVSRMLP